MNEISVDKVKEIALKILVNVAEFCKEHNLRYFLAYGTLLGAVRHKGFIPWDDDIDIQMPREDYNKLIELYNSEKTSDKYRLVAPTDAGSKHTFVKIIDTSTLKIEAGTEYLATENLGVDIDVFPIDGQPDDDDEYIKFYNRKRFCYKLWHYLISDKSKYTFLQNVRCCLIRLLFNKKFLMKIINKFHNQYDYNDSRYVGTTASIFNSIKNRFNREWFNEYILLEFEHHYFNAPIGYDEILKKRYGDYMKLPPVEQQKTHHSFTAYTIDE